MESEKNQIILKQLPIIVHQLQDAGKKVQERIDGLELDKQVFTEETVKSYKVLRAELNKELEDFESQRKFVKEGVNAPYLEFETVYKSEITERYKKAGDLLKSGIDTVEYKIKKQKQDNVKEYFNELCLSESIDFLKFEDVKLDINLSTSEKKYKEQTNTFVMKVVDDLALIKTTDYEAEILTQYKQTLNVSNAITTVKIRKENEEIEQAKIKAELIQNRKNALIKLGLNYVEITNSYEYNEQIFVSLSDVNNRTKEEFTTIHANIVVLVNAEKAKQLEVIETINVKGETYEVSKTEGINPATNHSRVVKPIQSPIVETPKEADVIASFEVKAPFTKLRELGRYMAQNGIEYKNI